MAGWDGDAVKLGLSKEEYRGWMSWLQTRTLMILDVGVRVEALDRIHVSQGEDAMAAALADVWNMPVGETVLALGARYGWLADAWLAADLPRPGSVAELIRIGERHEVHLQTGRAVLGKWEHHVRSVARDPIGLKRFDLLIRLLRGQLADGLEARGKLDAAAELRG